METTTTTKTYRNRMLAAACIVLLALALAACGSSSKGSASQSGSTPDISIQNTQFPASPVAVKAGATVTVKNNDAFTHTVTSDDGSSFNISIDAGKTATFTAPATAGTFKFHCNIHSSMHGTLTVS